MNTRQQVEAHVQETGASVRLDPLSTGETLVWQRLDGSHGCLVRWIRLVKALRADTSLHVERGGRQGRPFLSVTKAT